MSLLVLLDFSTKLNIFYKLLLWLIYVKKYNFSLIWSMLSFLFTLFERNLSDDKVSCLWLYVIWRLSGKSSQFIKSMIAKPYNFRNKTVFAGIQFANKLKTI